MPCVLLFIMVDRPSGLLNLRLLTVIMVGAPLGLLLVFSHCSGLIERVGQTQRGGEVAGRPGQARLSHRLEGAVWFRGHTHRETQRRERKRRRESQTDTGREREGERKTHRGRAC